MSNKEVAVSQTLAAGVCSTVELENPDMTTTAQWYVKWDTLHWIDMSGNQQETTLYSEVEDVIDWKRPSHSALYEVDEDSIIDWDNQIGVGLSNEH